MPDRKSETDEMRRLYEVEQLTLKAIGERFGLTSTAIYYRLRTRGVTFRGKGSRSPAEALNKNNLTRMYVNEKKSGMQIAREIGRSGGTVYKMLRAHGIERRKPAEWMTKHPELGQLKIGESLLLPRPKRRKFQHYFYIMAKPYGIRVSVRTIDEKSVRITRVE